MVRHTRPAPINTFISAEHRKRLERLSVALSEPGKRCSLGEVVERGVDMLAAKHKAQLRRVK